MAHVVKPLYKLRPGRRYSVFEADGTFVQAYQQRPAGERYAEARGFGFYDHRDNRILIAVDPDERLRRLRGRVQALRDEADEAMRHVVEAELLRDGGS